MKIFLKAPPLATTFQALVLILGIGAQGSPIVEVLKTADGSLWMESERCQDLEPELQSLKAWRQLTDPMAPDPSSVFWVQEPDRCRVSINEWVPLFLLHLQNRKAVHSGPNCWNNALKTLGFINSWSFSSDEEMTFWSQSPYCRPLTSNEPPEPGDLINIRERVQTPETEERETGTTPLEPIPFREVHGMIYVSPHLVYSKNSSRRGSIYGLQRSQLIYQNFNLVDESCLQTEGVPNHCLRWANYFRCQRPSTPLSMPLSISLSMPLSEEDLEDGPPSEWFESLRAIEHRISRVVFEGDPIDLEQIQNLQEQLLSLRPEQFGDAFIIKGLQLRIHSLQIQMGILRDNLSWNLKQLQNL